MRARLLPRIIALSLAAASSGLLHGSQDPPPTNPDGKVIVEFNRRTKEYAELHDKLEKTLEPIPEKPTPEQITEHQRALERLILRARTDAKQGDIFTESIRAYFRRQIARVLEGPDGDAVRHSILDEDTRAVRPQINSRYPPNIPVSNVPPQILLVLPRLPEELEYRFIGERLVLLDVHSYTIVDYIDRALSR
jgi:hypothetical protein